MTMIQYQEQNRQDHFRNQDARPDKTFLVRDKRVFHNSSTFTDELKLSWESG